MPITRDFRETVFKRAQRDRKFRQAMLTEAVNELLGGDLAVGKALLRDYIKATTSFDEVAGAVGKSDKSIQRMLGPRGNPTAENIFAIIKVLQEFEAVALKVKATRQAA